MADKPNNTIRNAAISIAVSLILMAIGALFGFVFNMQSKSSAVDVMVEAHTSDIKEIKQDLKSGSEADTRISTSVDMFQQITKEKLDKIDERNKDMRRQLNRHIMNRQVHK